MKSLPEKDFWNNIKTRLHNYTEDPGDDWDDLDAILSLSRYDSRKWLTFGGDVVSAILLIGLFLFFTPGSIPNQVVADTPAPIQNTNKQQDKISVKPNHSKSNEGSALYESGGIDHSNKSQKSSTTITAQNEPSGVDQSSLNNHQQRHPAKRNKGLGNSMNLARKGKEPISSYSTKTNTSVQPIDRIDESGISLNTTGNSTSNSSTSITSESNIDGNTINEDNAVKIVSNAATNSTESDINNKTTAPTGNAITVEKIKTDSSLMTTTKKKDNLTTRPGEDLRKKSYSKKFRPAVYITVSPTLAYQKVTPKGNDQVNVTGLKPDGIFSMNRAGFSFDAGFQLPVRHKLEWYIGASYYQQQETITYLYSAGKVNTIKKDDPMHYTLKPGTTQKEFSYAMQNAGIATGIFYHLKTDRLMHKFGAGIQYQQGFKQSAEGNSYRNAHSSYFNYQLLYRLELTVTNRVNIYLQPGFTHAIRVKEKLNEPFTLKPYHAAIGMGMVYRF
ncbi:hypothetical protein [Ohtaekwangia sp.]|uniref:hypothetical protein n=1 Tax=Ohtaekwangia sp. TaxID=2066019 RepID=UPI002FDCAFBF